MKAKSILNFTHVVKDKSMSTLERVFMTTLKDMHDVTIENNTNYCKQPENVAEGHGLMI